MSKKTHFSGEKKMSKSPIKKKIEKFSQPNSL